MTTEQATYRFLKIFLPSMLAYGVGSVTVALTADNYDVSPIARYAMATLPILGVLFAFWAHWRFVFEIDEYLRLIQIKATLFAIACVMCIAVGWGTFEKLANAPQLQIIWLLPIFFIAQSIATLFISKKEGVF